MEAVCLKEDLKGFLVERELRGGVAEGHSQRRVRSRNEGEEEGREEGRRGVDSKGNLTTRL